MIDNFIDPKFFGLTARDRVERLSTNHIALIVDRKSRIIMADGKRILEKVNKIQNHSPGIKVSLRTSAPVCSKTRTFLEGQGIEVRKQ